MNKYKNITELIVRLIIKRENKILLCINKKSKSPSYFLPGGHVEFGDTLEQTVYKEIKEELGWNNDVVSNVNFVGYLENSYTSSDDEDVHQELNMIFNATVAEDAIATSLEDHIGFEWVDIDKIDAVNIKPLDIKKFISQ